MQWLHGIENKIVLGRLTPALSKGEGVKMTARFFKVLSFGEDE